MLHAKVEGCVAHTAAWLCPDVVKVAAAGSTCNSSQVDLQAWMGEGIAHRIKVVHEGKGQWQERHEGAHFAELLNSPDPKQRGRAVHAAAQVLMYMVGRPMERCEAP